MFLRQFIFPSPAYINQCEQVCLPCYPLLVVLVFNRPDMKAVLIALLCVLALAWAEEGEVVVLTDATFDEKVFLFSAPLRLH